MAIPTNATFEQLGPVLYASSQALVTFLGLLPQLNTKNMYKMRVYPESFRGRVSCRSCDHRSTPAFHVGLTPPAVRKQNTPSQATPPRMHLACINTASTARELLGILVRHRIAPSREEGTSRPGTPQVGRPS